MKKNIILLSLIYLAMVSFKNDKPAYTLFTSDGKRAGYEKMIEVLSQADIVFFGELHDNPISHWLEYEITSDIYNLPDSNLILGAEMFEADNQLLIDEYLARDYEADKFEAEVKLWKNYRTDYKPLLDFAREKNLRFIATNIPRRYASMVSRNGFEILDSLAQEATQFIAPLPISYDPELKCYKEMMDMHGMPGMASKPNVNLPKAQAVKDATMAYFILKNFRPGYKFIHFNGSYHSENHLGIVHYLKVARPDLKIVTITTVMQKNMEQPDEENLDTADFIIVVPESMTRTY